MALTVECGATKVKERIQLVYTPLSLKKQNLTHKQFCYQTFWLGGSPIQMTVQHMKVTS
jgi:hypothetical protein